MIKGRDMRIKGDTKNANSECKVRDEELSDRFMEGSKIYHSISLIYFFKN